MALSAYQQIQQVREHYNTIGLHFAETRKKKLWPEVLPFLKNIRSGMRVLDVGCGSGRLLSELSKKKIKYVGLDFSETLIKIAKKQYPSRKFLIRDITNPEIWIAIGRFDAVVCLGVLHHIPDRRRQHEVLRLMNLHTKPGGFVLISVWNLWQWRFWKEHLRQLLAKFRHWDFSYLWIPYSVSNGKKIVRRVDRFCKAFFPGEILTLVRQAGYYIDTFYYAAKGKTHLPIWQGQNFCIFARKRLK